MVENTAPFELERQMISPVIRSLPTALRLSGDVRIRVLRQPQVGPIIPDLLVALTPLGARLFKPPRAFTVTEAAILSALLADGPLSQDEMAKLLYLPDGMVDRPVRALHQVGAIVREGHTVRLGAAARFTDFEVVAIELKLQRWREALEQAVEYKRFADRTYVVLDGNRVQSSADMRAQYAAAGVGLWLQRRHIIAEEIPASKTPPRSPDWYIVASKLASAPAKRLRTDVLRRQPQPAID